MQTSPSSPPGGNQSISCDTNDSCGSSKATKIDAVVGAIVGGLVAVAAVVSVLIYLRYRRRKCSEAQHELAMLKEEPTSQQYFPSSRIPYSPVEINIRGGPTSHPAMREYSITPFPLASYHDDLLAAVSSGKESESHPAQLPGRGTLYVTSTVAATGGASSSTSRSCPDTSDCTTFGASRTVFSSVMPVASPTVPATESAYTSSTMSGTRGSDSPSTTRVLVAKQTLLREVMRTQISELQRQMERFREERENGMLDEVGMAPPSYS